MIHIMQYSLSDKTLFYNHIIKSLNFLNLSNARGFVKISTCWSFVLMAFIVIVLFFKYCLKWWCLTHMCLFLGLHFGSLAKWRAPGLSSKTVEKVLICWLLRTINWFKYSMISLIGRRSLVLYDNAMHSASVVDKATSVWILSTQHIAQFAIFMMHPVRDRDDVISWLLKANQLPANST